MNKALLQRLLLPAAFAALVIVTWSLVRDPAGIAPFVLPTPAEIFRAGIEESDILFRATLNSVIPGMAGFLLAIAVSSVCALVLALSPFVRSTLFPMLMALQMTPIVVISPILLLWVGPGFGSVMTIAFIITFFPLVVNTTQGLVSIDPNQMDLLRMCSASRRNEILRLRLPSALPYFFTGLRISATLMPIGAVVGDLFAGNSAGGVGGLGYLTVVYSGQLQTAALFATALVCCLLGFALAGCVGWLAWLFLHKWHDAYARSDR